MEVPNRRHSDLTNGEYVLQGVVLSTPFHGLLELSLRELCALRYALRTDENHVEGVKVDVYKRLA